MINNGVASEYEFPKFDPMTCTIDELVRHWKEYTSSEPIWNKVRDDIYRQGVKDFIDYLNNNAFELRHDMDLIQEYGKKFLGE